MLLTILLLGMFLFSTRVVLLAMKKGEIRSYYEEMSANKQNEPKSYYVLLSFQIIIWLILFFIIVDRLYKNFV